MHLSIHSSFALYVFLHVCTPYSRMVQYDSWEREERRKERQKEKRTRSSHLREGCRYWQNEHTMLPIVCVIHSVEPLRIPTHASSTYFVCRCTNYYSILASIGLLVFSTSITNHSTAFPFLQVGAGSLSPRGDWRAPSDSSSAPWMSELETAKRWLAMPAPARVVQLKNNVCID